MSERVWKPIDEAFSLCERHGDFKKLSGLERDTAWGIVIDPYRESRCMLFRVFNSKNKSYHNVVIANKDGKLHIWCGDRYIQELGYEESPCWFWKNAKAGQPHCKHIAFVLDYLNSNPHFKRNIEQTLLGTTEGSAAQSKVSLAIRISKPILLYGPTGSGKTHAVLQAVRENGIPLYSIHISNGLEDIDLLQKILPDPETGKWQRIEGELVKAFRHAIEEKVAILLEEISRSSKSLRNLLIKAMDKKDNTYTLHDFTSGEYITVPAENIIWIATANLGGSYGDTLELDPAFMRRFSLTVFVDYDTGKEIQILQEIVDEKTARKMVEFANSIRENYLAGRLPCPLDTGTLVEWAQITAETDDPIESAELVFLYRIVERDSFGYPEKGQLEVIREELEKLF